MAKSGRPSPWKKAKNSVAFGKKQKNAVIRAKIARKRGFALSTIYPEFISIMFGLKSNNIDDQRST